MRDEWLMRFTSAPAREARPRITALMAAAAGVVALWAALCQLGALPPAFFPAPLDVARGLYQELQSGRLGNDVIASLFRVGAGLTLAVAVGVPLGLGLGHSARARGLLLPAINFLRSLSPLAWIPFAILWFGIGDAPVVFLIVMATLFPTALATAAAVANIPGVYLRVAANLEFRGVELLARVTLPAILPQLITAIRVMVGLAWLVVVAAEMVAGRDGLGFAIWDARNGLRMDLLLGGMILIGSIGVALDRLVVCLTVVPSVRWGYER
jgi:NitT/TauT family transport system permease protein